MLKLSLYMQTCVCFTEQLSALLTQKALLADMHCKTNHVDFTVTKPATGCQRIYRKYFRAPVDNLQKSPR